jgi:arsenical pump membrane protein
MPHLSAWLKQFGMPSIVSVAATYLVLRLTQRRPLAQEKIAHAFSRPRLAHGGRLTLWGIGAVALALLCCSVLDVQLGLPTFVCGVVTTAIVLTLNRQSPLPIIWGVSWGVLPLVAGLFVLVEALDHTGVIAAWSDRLHAAVAGSTAGATYSVGLIVGVASNLMNNLPVGLTGCGKMDFGERLFYTAGMREARVVIAASRVASAILLHFDIPVMRSLPESSGFE